ncbi:DUF2597 family protein [Methylomonas sp. EFPC1]|uniref:phage protein n=1 Tax=Methylomonas sp. EFPC1 TaxID=2812647 RepID=UPI0019674370|nr:phage protein [Methylomonas sp. EFPC1]QSB01973.1 DUF2597 family protein [Methylomonas sp. EFPC1]
MSNKRLSAQNFDIMVGDLLVHVETMSAQITDNRQPTFIRGVPDGYVDGDVACAGDIELDSKNFNLFTDVARSNGSWRAMPTFDIIYSGVTISDKQKIEMFGCLINITDLLNNDAKGGEKSKHKLSFAVTSPDFVRLNGVPYLDADDTRALLA